MARLAAQVRKLTAVAINRLHYTAAYTDNLGNVGATGGFIARPLLQFSSLQRTFGTDADDETAKKALVRKINGRWVYNTNEPDNRGYSIWVVSLKDEASKLLDTSGGLATLTQGTHYCGSSDRVLLNLKLFKVHYHKTWLAGTVQTQRAVSGAAPAVQAIGTTTGATQHMGHFNINMGKGMKIINPVGDWKAVGYPQDPSNNYFLLCFYEAESTADGEYGQLYTTTLVSVDAST